MLQPVTAASGSTSIFSSTFTLDNTSDPAFDGQVGSISNTQTETIKDVALWIDSGIAEDYAFNWDYQLRWDNNNSNLELLITVNWDTQPSSNVTAKVEVYQ